MTFLALAVGMLVVAQFPLLNIIYFVEPHVYAIAFVISVATIYRADAAVRLVSEPRGDADRARRSVTLRVVELAS